MRFIYTLGLYLLLPFVLIRLWWKGRRLPAYRDRIGERLGLPLAKARPVDVWLHAVSLGEVIAATPLIEAMLAKNRSILVTSMTPTGSARVLSQFGERVAHQYIPYDVPLFLRRFFSYWQPGVGVIIETELWPNLIFQARKSRIPLVLANARLSESSFAGYKRGIRFIKPVLNQFAAILAQSEEDAQRFLALGARQETLLAAGNIKFDLQADSKGYEQIQALEALWGERTVFIAASTHDKEEAWLLAELPALRQAIPNLLCLIAPRHPERFQLVYQLAVEAGFETALRSKPESIHSNTEVLVLDCLGELMHFYKLSDYAFVGGSLVPVGGHNVLEPIAAKVPVFSGKFVSNFKAICKALEEAKGIAMVEDAKGLREALIQLHSDKALKEERLCNASLVFEKNKGSLQRHLDCIERLLSHR